MFCLTNEREREREWNFTLTIHKLYTMSQGKEPLKNSNNFSVAVAASAILFIGLALTRTLTTCIGLFEWLGSQFNGVLLFAAGITLTLCITAFDVNKKVLGCALSSCVDSNCAARLKVLVLLLVGVVIKLLANGQEVNIWAEGYFAFNSALAGAYATHGWSVTTSNDTTTAAK